MTIDEIKLPTYGKGEFLVEVHAVGLNPVDYKTVTGGNPSWTYPHVIGLDVAGVVAELGEEVTQWKKGDRILYHGDMKRSGGLSTEEPEASADSVCNWRSGPGNCPWGCAPVRR